MGNSKRENDADVTRQNQPHLSDFHYAVQISVRLLRPIGAWPLIDDKATRFNIVLHKISMTIGTLLLAFTTVPWIMHLIKERLGIALLIRAICPFLFTITVFARYVLLLLHQDQLKSCIDHVVDDWRYTVIAEDREIMSANAKLGRTFGIVSVIFMFTCGIMFYTLPLTLPSVIDENNVTRRLHPTPCEFLVFDSKASPAYEIVYCLQLLSGFTIYSSFCGICSLMANFVTHICGQCDVLAYVFEDVVDGGKHNKGTIDGRIATAINRHLRLLKLATDVSGLFTEICLMEFINASCNICLLSYYIVTDWNNNEPFVQIFMYILALISILFNVYIFCYIGDLLAERCQQIRTVCYAIEWYRMPSSKTINLIMPIIMSGYPTSLTAGKMITMNLSTFSDILKTSMAYFNLLREFYSRDVRT